AAETNGPARACGRRAAVCKAAPNDADAVAWSPGDNGAIACAMPALYRDAATLPSTATPSAAPSSRVASFIADPAPARRGGTTDMIAAVIGEIVIAMPEIRTSMHTSTYKYDVSTLRSVNERNPIDTRLIPSPTVRLTPMRPAILGVIGATMSITGAIGRKRNAEPRGLNPRISWKYCVMRNITPNIARNTRIIPPVAVANARCWK